MTGAHASGRGGAGDPHATGRRGGGGRRGPAGGRPAPGDRGGAGVVLAGARRPLEDLADLTGALLATSALGNGLFTGNPCALGISGFASPVAAELLRRPTSCWRQAPRSTCGPPATAA